MNADFFSGTFFFKGIDMPYEETVLSIREQNFKMTQKPFIKNCCHVATQDMYRKSKNSQTVPLIRRDLIREA